MKYKVNEEGVEALQGMANALQEATKAIASQTVTVANAASGQTNVLGPHAASLEQALSAVKSALGKASASVGEIANTLNDVADDYQEIIDHDRLSGVNGGAGGAGGSGSAGGSGGGSGGSGGAGSEYSQNIARTPVNNGSWSGTRGESVWTPDNAFAQETLGRYGATGVSYRNGMPDFTPFAAVEFELNSSELQLSDAKQFETLNDELDSYLDDMAESLGADPADPLSSGAFRDWMQQTFKCDESEMEDILSDIWAGRTPYGYTWHHTEKPGVMQLVPTAIHVAARHRGGRSIWGGGAECRYAM